MQDQPQPAQKPPELLAFQRLFEGQTVYCSQAAYPAMAEYCASLVPPVRVEVVDLE